VEVVTVLLLAGAPIESQTQVMNESCDLFICVQDGRTPLHLACGHGAVRLVSELLAAGAQVDAEDQVWTVDIRVDLSSSGYMHSPPSCLL
jgi:ankyrin repeat protein